MDELYRSWTDITICGQTQPIVESPVAIRRRAIVADYRGRLHCGRPRGAEAAGTRRERIHPAKPIPPRAPDRARTTGDFIGETSKAPEVLVLKMNLGF
ncbi:MAG: hypothetical protein QM674_14400 [Burkholderiaceae bacterium]